jgi:hypothetical protein
MAASDIVISLSSHFASFFALQKGQIRFFGLMPDSVDTVGTNRPNTK